MPVTGKERTALLMGVNEGKRLAIVEDDRDLVQLLKAAFELEGYSVSVFFDALPFLRHVRDNGLPHLAVIDLGLPSMHGFELSKKLKALGDVPIIFISNQDEIDTVVRGLADFADDYVTKPFDIRELVARAYRVLSRVHDYGYTQSPIITVDDWLSVDFGNSRLLAGGQATLLTPTEAGLLHILIRNSGHIVPSDTLIARVWPLEQIFEDTLRVHMHRLRRKLERDYRHPQYIQTERGVGYRFVMAESEPTGKNARVEQAAGQLNVPDVDEKRQRPEFGEGSGAHCRSRERGD
jgi:DNA-binding response OmpR family regulator